MKLILGISLINRTLLVTVVNVCKFILCVTNTVIFRVFFYFPTFKDQYPCYLALALLFLLHKFLIAIFSTIDICGNWKVSHQC